MSTAAVHSLLPRKHNNDLPLPEDEKLLYDLLSEKNVKTCTSGFVDDVIFYLMAL